LHYYRNWRFSGFHFGKTMTPPIPSSPRPVRSHVGSVLAWPAWLRVLAVLPAVALLWLAVAWAQLEVAPW
jgi:hypothetical protein